MQRESTPRRRAGTTRTLALAGLGGRAPRRVRQSLVAPAPLRRRPRRRRALVAAEPGSPAGARPGAGGRGGRRGRAGPGLLARGPAPRPRSPAGGLGDRAAAGGIRAVGRGRATPTATSPRPAPARPSPSASSVARPRPGRPRRRRGLAGSGPGPRPEDWSAAAALCRALAASNATPPPAAWRRALLARLPDHLDAQLLVPWVDERAGRPTPPSRPGRRGDGFPRPSRRRCAWPSCSSAHDRTRDAREVLEAAACAQPRARSASGWRSPTPASPSGTQAAATRRSRRCAPTTRLHREVKKRRGAPGGRVTAGCLRPAPLARDRAPRPPGARSAAASGAARRPPDPAAGRRDPPVHAAAQRASAAALAASTSTAARASTGSSWSTTAPTTARATICSARPDAHLFLTTDSYAVFGGGMRWLNHLLDRHGTGAWCLTVDVDEVLAYPHAERMGLQHLTEHLDRQGAQALFAFMLDMYAEDSLHEWPTRRATTPGPAPASTAPATSTATTPTSRSGWSRAGWCRASSTTAARTACTCTRCRWYAGRRTCATPAAPTRSTPWRSPPRPACSCTSSTWPTSSTGRGSRPRASSTGRVPSATPSSIAASRPATPSTSAASSPSAFAPPPSWWSSA